MITYYSVFGQALVVSIDWSLEVEEVHMPLE